MHLVHGERSPIIDPTASLLVSLNRIAQQFAAERDYQPEVFTIKNTIWYVLFSELLCGYNGMFPQSAFGQVPIRIVRSSLFVAHRAFLQTVTLLSLINGLLNLSLAIEARCSSSQYYSSILTYMPPLH